MLAEDLLRPSNVHVLRGLVQLGRLRAANTDMKGCMRAVHVFHTYVFIALSSVLICIHMRCGNETYLQSHLFSWLFPSCTVAGVNADLSSPLALSVSSPAVSRVLFKSRWHMSFHHVFGHLLFLFPGLSVPNTFLSMCSPSLFITCPYQFTLLSVIFL